MARHRTAVSRIALAIAFIVTATPAVAQNRDPAADKPSDQTTPLADTPDAVAPGDIIITANKRAENIQRVPLAVSVVSPAQLDATGVHQFQDLGKVTPSLTIRPAEQPVNSNVSLRGVGTFAFGIGVESSVAVLVDEVPLAFSARAFSDLPDVERIEVLRGPQSTLYGKSASAGLINVITRDPTKEFHFRANALGTTDSEYGANFSISGPASDTLGYILSASYSNWDGNVKNLFNGKEVNGHKSFNARGKLRWEPTAGIRFTLSANYLNGDTSVGRPFVHINPAALFRGTAGLTLPVVMPGVTFGPDNQTISNNYDSRTHYEGGGGSLRGEVDLGGDMTLISISSYDRFHQWDYLDQDDTSYSGNLGNNNQVGQLNSKMATQELRLQSATTNPFHYTVGAFYAKVDFNRPFVRGPYFSVANWYATYYSRQLAGFVQAEWEFAPHVTLTGGARVQNEKIGYTFTDYAPATPARYSGSADDTAFTWKANLNYQVTPDVMLFATYATGYKGQTYDLTTGFNNNRAAAGPIKPERSRDREVGIRSQFLDRRLTVNLTYFNTDYTNLQAQTIETLADGTSNYRLTNVGGLNTSGVELDSSLRASDDLNLSASAAYLDAHYTSYPIAQCYPLQTIATGCNTTVSPSRQNLTGQRAVQAPKWRVTAAVDYSPALGGHLRGVVQANWQYTSDVYYVAEDPETFQPAYSIFNAGLGVRDADRRWEVVAFVNNVFDKRYFPSLVNTAGNFGGTFATQAVLPRDFRRYAGLRLGVNF